MYACMHGCMYAWMYVCMHACVYVCVCVCVRACMRACVRARACISISIVSYQHLLIHVHHQYVHYISLLFSVVIAIITCFSELFLAPPHQVAVVLRLVGDETMASHQSSSGKPGLPITEC